MGFRRGLGVQYTSTSILVTSADVSQTSKVILKSNPITHRSLQELWMTRPRRQTALRVRHLPPIDKLSSVPETHTVDGEN